MYRIHWSNLQKSRFSNIRKIRTLENRVSLRTFQCFLMKWSFVQHLRYLKPSSILTFQGASIGKGLWFFKVVPEWHFQKLSETRVFFWVLLFFIYNESKKSVNPMVWRCREFFFYKIFCLFNFFQPVFFEFYFLGVISVF